MKGRPGPLLRGLSGAGCERGMAVTRRGMGNGEAA